VINEVVGGRLFLRAGMMDEATDLMREVTIFNFDDPTHRKTIYADSGRMNLSPDQRDLVLTLHHGYMQQIPQTNTAELERLYFMTDFVRVRNVGNKFEETEKDTYKSEREMSVCEMDSMFQSAHHEEEVARHDLAATMRAAVHLAATGEPPTFEKTPPQERANTVGSLYCRLVKRISPKVEAAEAAELQTPAPPQTAASRQIPAPAPAKGPPSVKHVQPATARPPLPVHPGPQPPAAEQPVHPAVGRPALVQRMDLDEGTRAATAGALAFAQTLPRLQIARSRVNDARLTASRYATEIQKKFALAAACAVFVLLGAPVGLRFPRGGVGMVLGVSVVVFGLYYIGLVAGEAAADRLVLSPFWGMWMTNVLCSAIGIVLMVRVQRSGATARGGDWHEMLESAKAWWAARRARGTPAAPEAA
jgi:lipopolysaccharide export system permease protein